MSVPVLFDDELLVLRLVRDVNDLIGWAQVRRATGIERAALQRIARRLADEGLIQPADEHAALVVVTPRGREVLDRYGA